MKLIQRFLKFSRSKTDPCPSAYILFGSTLFVLNCPFGFSLSPSGWTSFLSCWLLRLLPLFLLPFVVFQIALEVRTHALCAIVRSFRALLDPPLFSRPSLYSSCASLRRRRPLHKSFQALRISRSSPFDFFSRFRSMPSQTLPSPSSADEHLDQSPHQHVLPLCSPGARKESFLPAQFLRRLTVFSPPSSEQGACRNAVDSFDSAPHRRCSLLLGLFAPLQPRSCGDPNGIDAAQVSFCKLSATARVFPPLKVP